MAQDLFEGIEQSHIDTSRGRCALPILHTDGSALGLLYRVDVARAAACLAEALPGAPLEIFPLMGSATVQIAAFEHRRSTLGPHLALALSVAVCRRGSRPSALRALFDPRGAGDQGMACLTRPVTSEAACAAGRELWGFPAYVAAVETDFRPSGVRVELGGELDILIGPPGRLHTPGMPLLWMSVHRGRLLRTTVEVGHRLRWGVAATTELRIQGDGPTARFAARLGLDTMKPSFAWRTLAMRAILPLGEDLGACD